MHLPHIIRIEESKTCQIQSNLSNLVLCEFGMKMHAMEWEKKQKRKTNQVKTAKQGKVPNAILLE